MTVEFYITEHPYPTPHIKYSACLNECDPSAHRGTGFTPADAIIDWLEMHGDALKGEQSQ